MLSIEQVILIFSLAGFLLYGTFFIFLVQIFVKDKNHNQEETKNPSKSKDQSKEKVEPSSRIFLTEIFKYGDIKITVSNDYYTVEDREINKSYLWHSLPLKYKKILKEFLIVQKNENLIQKNGNLSIYKDEKDNIYSSETKILS